MSFYEWRLEWKAAGEMALRGTGQCGLRIGVWRGSDFLGTEELLAWEGLCEILSQTLRPFESLYLALAD